MVREWLIRNLNERGKIEDLHNPTKVWEIVKICNTKMADFQSDQRSAKLKE